MKKYEKIDTNGREFWLNISDLIGWIKINPLPNYCDIDDYYERYNNNNREDIFMKDFQNVIIKAGYTVIRRDSNANIVLTDWNL